MKPPNPFTPGKRLTRPDLFAGRTPQLRDGAALLDQAAAGNVRHALITGDRGIGKSSLASQIEGVAVGDARFIQLLNGGTSPPRNFLVAEHIAQRGEGVPAISRGLLSGLDRARKKSRSKVTWDIEVALGPFKARVREAAGDPKEATAGFVDAIETIQDNVGREFEGVLLVIDEIDRVAEEPGVPTFFKVASEMLTARGLENVILLPVGMVGVQELLKAEHASVGRVFEVIHVPSLNEAESLDILTRALDPTGIKIEDDVAGFIAHLANGFPHPVHLLGSEAYDADADGVIDEDDVDAAVTSVVSEKWKEEFDASFVAAGSGKNRDILRVMADYRESDVPMAYICEKLGVRQPEISSNLNLLMKRDVIIRVDRGVYRIKDRLFSIYVSYMNVLGEDPIEVRPRKRRSDARRKTVT